VSTETCPKCGAEIVSALPNWREFACYSHAYVNSRFTQTDYCRIRQLEAAISAARKALVGIDWITAEDVHGNPQCCWCGNNRDKGHASDCELVAARKLIDEAIGEKR
jgi:hypothetical protein